MTRKIKSVSKDTDKAKVYRDNMYAMKFGKVKRDKTTYKPVS